MSIIRFPNNAPYRITLPLPQLPGSTPSWRTVFPRLLIPVLTANNQAGADAEGYFPVCAVFLEAVGCKPTICEDAVVFVDDGISRCSIAISAAKVIPPTGTTPLAQSLEYCIKAAMGAVPSPIDHASVLIDVDPLDPLAPSTTQGIMAEVSGILCTEFQLWARIPDGQGAMPVEVRFQMMVDRAGSAPFAYEGFKDLPHLP